MIYYDKNINVWFISLGFIEIPFWKWGFGIDKREGKMYKNIFRFRIRTF